MAILNLTRAVLPDISKLSRENSANVATMPEMVLNKLMHSPNGNQIVHVGMNECKTVRILPSKVNTIYTDGLATCNAVGIISKDKEGNPIAILSHFMPSLQSLQARSIEKQLETYGACFCREPKVFYNVPGYQEDGILKPCVNSIFEKLKPVFDKFFKGKVEEHTTLYQTKNRPAFFSSANIFQFDPKNPSQCKITSVGEKESFYQV